MERESGSSPFLPGFTCVTIKNSVLEGSPGTGRMKFPLATQGEKKKKGRCEVLKRFNAIGGGDRPGQDGARWQASKRHAGKNRSESGVGVV